jgi:CBS domain-containing protein
MVVERRSTPHPGKPFQVVWTRGRGCRELAELLGGDTAIRSAGDLTDACVEARADMVVARKLLPSFDLVPVAVPMDLPAAGFGSVVAAVAGGPHSALAAEVAAVIGRSASVPASMVCAYRDDSEADARAWVDRLLETVPDLSWSTVQVESVGDLIARIPDDALLVLGAPGGTWFQRLFFGAGARLRQAAANGAVIVRSAPLRAFHVMVEPVYVAPLIGCAEALRVTSQRVLPVVEGGRLIGMVTRSALAGAPEGSSVADVLQPAIWVEAVDPATAAEERAAQLGADLVPVVGREESLVGVVEVRPQA